MSGRSSLAVAGALALLAAGQARAGDTTFGGTLDLRVGYGSNPYLSSTNRGGSGLVGGTLTAGITNRTALSTTTLTGTADVSQNFRFYGRNQNYTIDLARTQQLSERVSVFGDASYANTLNPGISYLNTFSSGAIYPTVSTTAPAVVSGVGTTSASDPALIATSPVVGVPVGVFDASQLDLFTLGQRSERISGSGGANWTPSARDQFSLSGYGSRTTYKRFPGDYVGYGGTASYLRTLNARTRVGVDGGVNFVESDNYPGARSYSANLILIQQLSAIWSFNGRIGAIIPAGIYSQGQNVTLGFSGSLCGTYPRSSICLSAARQAAPTGIGGLRTDLQFTASLSYALDERTRVNAAATYDQSPRTILVPRQEYYQGTIGASRDLGRRFALGASARYQKRVGTGYGLGGYYPSASGYAVTVDFITRFGHLSR